MKLTMVLFFLAITRLMASEAYSQTARVTLQLKDATVKEVLSKIEDNSEFFFLYNGKLVDANRKVSVDASDEKISEILRDLFRETDVCWTVVDRQIVLTDKAHQNSFIQSGSPQQQKITGTITDKNGDPIIGANVVVTGTTIGTVTDISGKYIIDVPQGAKSLTFTFIGMEPQEIKIGTSNQINVTLVEAAVGLDEVIVVGYGTQKKSDITGSVASVSKTRLAQLPVISVMQAIEGSVAGVNVTQTSSVPGSSPQTLIRGVNSINASTSPFIVLDGMPFSGGMNDINMNDIASVEILKDASAVAIYGTRGSNGVILITTKRGGTGKPSIRYSVYTGIDNFAHILEPMSGPDYVTKYAEYMKQAGLTPAYPVPNLNELAYYNEGKTTDWIKETTQRGLIQDHTLSISGGAKDIKYYISGEFLKQQGIIKGYQYNRANIRSNLDVNITSFLSAGTSLFFNNNNMDGGRANLLMATAMSPYAPVYDANGSYQIYPMAPELLYTNPLLGLTTDRIDRNRNINGNVYAELTPGFVKGLKYRVNASITSLPGNDASYTGRLANDLIGSASASNWETKNWTVENILSYFRDINKHHIDFTGLYSAQSTSYFSTSTGSTGFINDQLSYSNLGAGATPFAGSYQWRSTMLSQMARVNYSYNNRYLLTLTARRDGYSAFGENKLKYGIFPSFALGWNINKENFMQNITSINTLKLRFSYGKSGNYDIGVNQTETTAGSVRVPISGVSTIGVLAGVLGNGNLHWESTKSMNLGLDLSALKNRLNVNLDLYNNRSYDLLLRRNIPQVSGYSSILDNLGLMENKGLELTLNTVNVSVGDFKWETNINFATNRNKLLDIYGDKKDDIANGWFIGKPLYSIYDYEKVGVWQVGEDRSNWDPTAQDGDLKFKDQLTVDTNGDGKPDKGDGQINDKDKKVLGTMLPKWTGGMTNTFHYKNLHLSVFIQTFQGALKNDVDLNYADEIGRRNTPADVGYWTAENKNNDRPSLTYFNTKNYGYPKDDSYTRIKDVTLSYTFPKELLQKIKLEGLTIYASGRNLYTFTKWIGWDPENNYATRVSGNSADNYPNVRSIIFGVNISLQ